MLEFLQPYVFPLLYFSIAVIALLIATCTDLKERIIPNSLTYSVIAIGIALHAVQSFLLQDYFLVAIALMVTVAAFIFAYLLWKAGVWAGGDVKLFTAVSSLNPFNYFFLGSLLGFQNIQFFNLLQPISIPIFPLTLFLFSLFAMIPYAVIISISGLMKNPEIRGKIKDAFKINWKQRLLQAFELVIIIQGIKVLLSIISMPAVITYSNMPLPVHWIFGFAGLILISLIPEKNFILKAIKYAVILILLAISLLLSQDLFSAVEFIIFNALIIFLLFNGLKLLIHLLMINREVLKEEKKISELEEGDIPAETIVEADSRIERVKPLNISKIINYFRERNMQELLQKLQLPGKQLTNPRRAAGLTEEEVKKLKELIAEGRLEDRIYVKLSAPFAPAILMGFIILSLIGDLLWNLVL